MATLALPLAQMHPLNRWPSFRCRRHIVGLYISFLGPLAACVVGITLTWGFGVDTPIVGDIPKGLPPITFDMLFPVYDIGTLFPKAIIIAAV
jgi:MFS superfamily sulfate permease-like transporter